MKACPISWGTSFYKFLNPCAAQVVGYIKGKSAVHIARTYGGHRANITGRNFWARGYFVSTVGAEEAAIRSYITRQEETDLKIDQMKMFQG